MVKKYDIAVIRGDGIGPEVIEEAIKVLKTLSDIYGFGISFKEYSFGADHYLATGEMLPDSELKKVKDADAILLGAIGDPRVETGVLERGIVGKLRFDLDLYVNLRPIKLYAEHICPIKDKKPQDIDIIVVRENTEDVYSGGANFFKKFTSDEVAFQGATYTRKGTERIIRYAFELAKKRPRRKLTLCDKANAVQAHELWRRTFGEVAKEYPSVQTDFTFVDAMCMWLIKKPEEFDVIVTTNMFGDIITDLGAIIQGGLGIAAGGNINPGKTSMFEPIHGSAPKYKGQHKANPLGAIEAAGMMLDQLGQREACEALQRVVINLIASKHIKSLSTGSGLATNQIGDMVVAELNKAFAPTQPLSVHKS